MKTYILYNPLAGHSETAAQREALATRYEGEVSLLDITKIEDYSALLSPPRRGRQGDPLRRRRFLFDEAL